MCYARGMKTKLLLFLLMLLVFGLGCVTGGLLLKPCAAPASPAAPQVRVARVSNVVPAEEALKLSVALSEIEALKAEKTRLQKQLSERTPPPEEGEEEAFEPSEEAQMSMRVFMEELKEHDPEQYEEIMRQRAAWEMLMAEVRRLRANFFNSLDTSLLTPEELANHTRYLELLKKRDALEAQFDAAMENDEEITEEMSITMAETMEEMYPIQIAEREALFKAVATSMGLQGADVEAFAAIIHEVIGVTSDDPSELVPPDLDDAEENP